MLFFHHIRFFSRVSVCFGILMTLLVSSVLAANPYSAYYSSENDNIFWFILITDTHIGARGVQDSNNLNWVVTEGKNVINPEFIVVSGDLTDSTNGNWFGIPQCGPFLSEWQEYNDILTGKVDDTNYYDIPGNHDAYCDQYFDFYLANSVQGQATGSTQVSWTRDFSFGNYHFLGINTADNTGDAFSISWPWGDYAGLDPSELSFIQAALALNSDADLTFVFGHHPVTDTGVSDDTWLYYGASEFVSLLDQNGISLYGYGHTHRSSEELFTGDSYTGYTSGGGIVYFNIKSLGKSTDDHFSVIAIDCNGVSTKTQTIGDWPLVLITSPVNHEINVPNPYAYSIPDMSDNPLRALVFDANAVSLVQYRIDGGNWYAMQQNPDNPNLWEAIMDNSGTPEGLHSVEVQATGSGTKSDTISIYVASSNQEPVADNQLVTTNEDTDINILLTASDPDNDPLTYQILLQPDSGILTGTPPNLIYSPYADYYGWDNFTFNVFDGFAYSNEASVAISVEPVNDAPVAVNDNYSVDQDQTLSVPAPGVTINDGDIDGDPLTAVLDKSPSNGTLQWLGNGAFNYTPTGGFTGSDSFTYAADDGSMQSAPATVTITVNPVSIPDTTPPEPDPMTWSQPPQSISSTSITMTATTATDANGVEYYFTCTAGGGNDSGWQESPLYTDTGLIPATEYTYIAKARDLSINQNETGAATAVSVFTDTANHPPAFTSTTVTEIDATTNIVYSGATLADNATDPDADDTLTFSKTGGPAWLNVASDGSLSGTPGLSDIGLNQFAVQVEDTAGETDTATLEITVKEEIENEFDAEGEIFNQATVEGNYTDTTETDNTYEKLTEVIKANKWSLLEHTWIFNITGSASVVFNVEAYHNQNTEGDDFVFAYSVDNVNFTDMFIISKTVDDDSYNSFELPPYITGPVYIRVMDTDRTRGNTNLETLLVDDMFVSVSGEISLPEPAFNPNPFDYEASVDINPTLTWSAGEGAVWHDVYFGDTPENLQIVSEGQTQTSFTPETLSSGSTYYWRIDEGNSAGTTSGNLWQFTTAAGGCMPDTALVDSIVTDTLKGPAGTSFGQAVVTIIDNCGSPVIGAEVEGHFTGDFDTEAPQTKTTNSDGLVSFQTGTSVKKPQFGFEVDSVTP